MSLPYHIVFGVLVGEMVLLAVLMLPLPASWRKWMLRSFAQMVTMQGFRMTGVVVFCLVAMLFGDSLMRIFYLGKELVQIQLTHGLDSRNDCYIRSKLFYAERNSYLTGMTLFLSLIMYRFQVIIADLIRVEENHGVLAKQLEGRQKEYERVLEENKALQGAGEEVRKLKADKEALQKQAEGLTREYDRLSKEHQTLQEAGSGGPVAKKDN